MIKVQGHRGYSAAYPENTMISFQKTYETGCFGIEMDVRVTADGDLIIMHDTTVDRTTDGTGAVASITSSYIATLDAGYWYGAEFVGIKVPTLDEVLDEFSDKNAVLLIHLNFSDTTKIALAIDKIATRNMINKVQIFGGMDTINFAKSYNPLLFTLNSSAPTIANYQTYIDNAIANNHDAVSINAEGSTSDLQTMINAIKYAGKFVHASYLYTNYASELDRHIALGTDYILGNDPKTMQEHIDYLTPPEYLAKFCKIFGEFAVIDEGKLKVVKYAKIDGVLLKTDTCYGLVN